ncbi:MAG TPA: response regulator, partial [Bryobacteraceae bacterium]|nr:response regulator [Bryobacteraceae bacterium]
RNAVSHGIESESERLQTGKPAVGTIRLLLRSRGERMQMIVEDDGRGIDYQALAAEATRQGLPEAGSISGSDEALNGLIFRPGFSTSPGVTTLAGRGMGLSIVRHEVDRLHGEIRIHSEPQKGLRITISVPLSLSTQRVLLVSAGGHVFGILSSFVEGLYRFEKSAIRTVEGRPAILIDSQPVTLVHLAELLHLAAGNHAKDKAKNTAGDNGEAGKENGMVPAALVSVGRNRAAIAVDGLLDVRDAVVKPTGLLAGDSGIAAGAIPMRDGSVAVILNAAELADRFRLAGAVAVRAFAPPEEKRHTILVVDDSITTRSLEKSLLEANGYRVELAVDGVQALEKLRSRVCDLVITDITMRRMGGFELLEQIRRDDALKQTPVIVVSSVESHEEQVRGLALGADAWVVKRKFDQAELLRTVRQIL